MDWVNIYIITYKLTVKSKQLLIAMATTPLSSRHYHSSTILLENLLPGISLYRALPCYKEEYEMNH